MQAVGGGVGHVLGAEGVGGAVLGRLQGLVEKAAQVRGASQGDQAAEGALTVIGGRGQQQAGVGAIGFAEVDALADAGRRVAALEGVEGGEGMAAPGAQHRRRRRGPGAQRALAFFPLCLLRA